MSVLTAKTLALLTSYDASRPSLDSLGKSAVRAIEIALRDANLPVLVSYRVKTTRSLRDKLRKRRPRDPRRLLYDTLGCRVMTYYDADVDRVVSHLRQDLDVRKVSDRRARLPLKAFGYRSVHLRARLRDARTGLAELESLGRKEFEIQVRSVLEHAWAEIEHEVVYKGGTEFPKPVVRRFASVAGALEVLEREFLGLRDGWLRLVEVYRSDYSSERGYRERFDAARIAGFLEARFPDGLGWRRAIQIDRPFETHSERLAAQALIEAGCGNARQLDALLNTRTFRRAVGRYAGAEGIAADEVNHMALVLIALGLKRMALLEEYFFEALSDGSLRAALRL